MNDGQLAQNRGYSMTTLLGTTLNGRYRLEARIGSGGMSTVYRATDETLQRQVAIKLMNREVTSDSDQLERFRREARAVAQLSHPHIVGVIDAGEDLDPTHPRPYIVFEYVEAQGRWTVCSTGRDFVEAVEFLTSLLPPSSPSTSSFPSTLPKG